MADPGSARVGPAPPLNGGGGDFNFKKDTFEREGAVKGGKNIGAQGTWPSGRGKFLFHCHNGFPGVSGPDNDRHCVVLKFQDQRTTK